MAGATLMNNPFQFKRQRLALPESGIALSLCDWGGEGPLLLMHHANGFCAPTFGLLAEALRSEFHVVGIDARGHGDSSIPEGAHHYRWECFVADILAVAERLAPAHGGRVSLSLGHSLGGTTTLLAAAARPDLFDRLLLVEPVMLPPPEALLQRLIEGARRRRTHWSSRHAARQYFSTLSFFAVWEPRVLDLYIEEGLAQRADGSVVLKCPGEVEATIFAAAAGLNLPSTVMALDCSISVLWAKRSTFFPRSCYEELVRAIPRGRLLEVDAGHWAPMERPDIVVQAAREIPHSAFSVKTRNLSRRC